MSKSLSKFEEKKIRVIPLIFCRLLDFYIESYDLTIKKVENVYSPIMPLDTVFPYFSIRDSMVPFENYLILSGRLSQLLRHLEHQILLT